ncbi:MAG: UbiD family decarboxylase [Deltaproteobacteria bacterium]|nr:UbiD family decarboxylase [Deltaproteobacteria bacterium]
MSRDLRGWIEEVELKAPGELLRVKRSVAPDRFEPTALLEQLEDRGEYPAVLFERITNLRGEPTPFMALMNVFGNPRKIGLAMGLAEPAGRAELFQTYLRRAAQPRKVQVVGPGEAPAKEVVVRGRDLDLAALPFFRHNYMEGGPYFTGIVGARALDSQRYNISWNRMMYLDATHMATYMSPRHLWSHFYEAEEQGQALPGALVLGHHPGFHLASAALTTLNDDEYEVAGGVLGEPLRVTPSEAYGEALLVPADAEVLIEGEIVPHRRTIEGPYGEFTGYTGPERLSWLFEVKALSMRRDAIFIEIFGSHRDNMAAHFPIEAHIYDRVRHAVPTVKDLCWIESGGPHNLIISIKKRIEGEPLRAAMAAIAASNFIKHVIVVDEDIDPGDLREVSWALATRFQAEDDLTVLKGMQGHVLDPSLRHEIRGSGMVLDCTVPLDRPYPRRARVPKDVRERMPLGEYLPDR